MKETIDSQDAERAYAMDLLGKVAGLRNVADETIRRILAFLYILAFSPRPKVPR